MGDRANIVIYDRRVQSDESQVGIYLYTHWNGSEWPERLRLALDTPAARRRWNDPSYLTRILVANLFEDLGLGETGGGISTVLTDNGHEIIVVDLVREQVSFASPGNEPYIDHWQNTLSFEDFCGQVEAKYPSER